MSATIETKIFKNYFNKKIVSIHSEGRVYPVKEIYRPYEDLDIDG